MFFVLLLLLVMKKNNALWIATSRFLVPITTIRERCYVNNIDLIRAFPEATGEISLVI
jgi:hypothetical protein